MDGFLPRNNSQKSGFFPLVVEGGGQCNSMLVPLPLLIWLNSESVLSYSTGGLSYSLKHQQIICLLKKERQVYPVRKPRKKRFLFLAFTCVLCNFGE